MYSLLRHSLVSFLRFALISACLLMLTSCSLKTQEVVPCEDVLHPVLWSVPFDELDADNVEAWIAAQFPGAAIISDGPGAFAWGANGKDFKTFFDADASYRYLAQYPGGRLELSANSSGPPPTVTDIVRCFGPPDLYAVQSIPSEVWQVRFSLWYLSRGLIFQTQEDKGTLPKKFSLASPLEGPFLVVPPGSPEQMAASWWPQTPITSLG